MKNKECYLVMVSSGEWEDNVKFNTGTVFLSLLSAEKELEKIYNYYTTVKPFPFDWCTEKEFIENSYANRNMDEEELIYDRWWDENREKEEFNSCWIETLKLEE